ncbi:hypothetical protein DAPPUDRAFT_307866 [Daphnia pulex]|uniref:Uncharacterized protein n=1 Tax=Daphnia pulex TaxID=6669 RepID=E9G1X9_DAPPU|nr:hypothetical protein DAPPUDRAFT_307866 [Daphnia pulex]|eukprot:EFX86730.1 hypothetical protein DAPPUDRAFT_307866 [Daphnia pulex]
MANTENQRKLFAGIVTILRGNHSQLEKVLWFLSKTTGREQIYIELLESAYVSNKEAFQELVERLGEDVDELNRNPPYKRVMDEMWLNHSLPSDGTNFVRGQRLDFQVTLEKRKRFEMLAICLGISILLRLDVLTPESLQKMFPLFNITSPLTNLLNIKELLSISQKLSGDRYEVTASFFYFGCDIFRNWKRHGNSEISGVRCVKNIVDSFTELAPGVAGGFGGELFGSTITPGIGTLVGGVGGGMASTFVCGALFDRLTQWIFNLPKDELLEKAFRDLDLPCNVSNNEINIKFVRLAHQNPPNPPNSDWMKLKGSINTIKKVKV